MHCRAKAGSPSFPADLVVGYAGIGRNSTFFGDAVDIAEWLRGLGLDRYEAAFRENAIDLEVLPEITETDLEKLGVLLGHRKRMLRAIDELRTEQRSKAPQTGTHQSEQAERRQLTVMFCDLVGSTMLATRLDPEDLREIIGPYHRRVAETVDPFGGFVAKYMGDGVLIYFGYPQAHEDDPERAVRAGLAVIDAVGRLSLRQRLSYGLASPAAWLSSAI